MNDSEKELQQALADLDESKLDEHIAAIESLRSSRAAPTITAGAAIPGVPYCNEYKTGRVILKAALKFIEIIPIIGKKVAKLIRLLMAIADLLCVVSSER